MWLRMSWSMLIGEGVYWMVVGRLREMSRLGNVVVGRPIKSVVRMDSLRGKKVFVSNVVVILEGENISGDSEDVGDNLAGERE